MKRFDKSTGLICHKSLLPFSTIMLPHSGHCSVDGFCQDMKSLIRIILASVVFTAFFRLTDDNLLAALRAFNAEFFPDMVWCFYSQENRDKPGISVGTIFDNKVLPQSSQISSVTSSAILTVSSFASASFTASARSG